MVSVIMKLEKGGYKQERVGLLRVIIIYQNVQFSKLAKFLLQLLITFQFLFPIIVTKYQFTNTIIDKFQTYNKQHKKLNLSLLTQMISQSIRTSKYKTTIDIPAEKLHTRAKFIQIPRQQPTEETIVVPGNCHGCNGCQSNRNSSLQTKIMIQELEKAYNDDMKQYERKLQNLDNSHNLQKVKLQSSIHSLEKELVYIKQHGEDSLRSSANSKDQFERKNQQLKMQLGQKIRINLNQEQEIKKLKNLVASLQRQNRQMSKLKIQQFVTEQQEAFKLKYVELEKILQRQKTQSLNLKVQLDNIRQSNQQLYERLRKSQENLAELKETNRKLIQEKDFQTQQIESYIKQIKSLQEDNYSLKIIIQKQQKEIRDLIAEMREQTSIIDKYHMMKESRQAQNSQILHQSQIKQMAERLVDYEQLLEKKDKELVQLHGKYLLKLKQCDQSKFKITVVEEQLLIERSRIQGLQLNLKQLTKQNEKITVQLSKLIIQNKELLSRPAQEKVYEVKIQKSVDRKEYIAELQLKVQQLNKVIKELQQGNQSYVQEIKKRILTQKSLRKHQQSLQNSVRQLKEHIAKKENSISWIVQRQIAKDVELSRNEEGSEIKSQSHSKSYKVQINQVSKKKSSDNSSQLSYIDKKEAINFSIQSKVQKLLNKYEGGSQIRNKNGQGQQQDSKNDRSM